MKTPTKTYFSWRGENNWIDFIYPALSEPTRFQSTRQRHKSIQQGTHNFVREIIPCRIINNSSGFAQSSFKKKRKKKKYKVINTFGWVYIFLSTIAMGFVGSIVLDNVREYCLVNKNPNKSISTHILKNWAIVIHLIVVWHRERGTRTSIERKFIFERF